VKESESEYTQNDQFQESDHKNDPQVEEFVNSEQDYPESEESEMNDIRFIDDKGDKTYKINSEESLSEENTDRNEPQPLSTPQEQSYNEFGNDFNGNMRGASELEISDNEESSEKYEIIKSDPDEEESEKADYEKKFTGHIMGLEYLLL